MALLLSYRWFRVSGSVALPLKAPIGSWRSRADRDLRILDMSVSLRQDAPPNKVELAVAKCLIATMDKGRWLELGLLTETRDSIQRHPRLLRALHWEDEDYSEHVYGITPKILGYDGYGKKGALERFPNLDVVAEFLDLPAWLALNEPDLYGRIIEGGPAAILPDGTVLSAADSMAVELGVAEMRRQVARIQRDLEADPEAALGHSKELVETTCKTILGLTGDQTESLDLPALIKKTQVHLGLDPAHVSDPVTAQAEKRILGGVSSILNGAGELRNNRGTGHGRSGARLVDPALARLTVGLAIATVNYLGDVWMRQGDKSGRPVDVAHVTATEATGGVIQHETYGEGEVLRTQETLYGVVATVDFGRRVGTRQILLHR